MSEIENELFEISKKYGINELIFVTENHPLCEANGLDSYINRSFIIGNDRIEIGIYDDENLLIASFFHELGHIVDKDDERYFNSEERAWTIGFKLAAKHGYTFTDDTLLWANEQLQSYNT